MNQSPEHTFDFLQPTDRNLTFTCCPVALQFLVLTCLCSTEFNRKDSREKNLQNHGFSKSFTLWFVQPPRSQEIYS